MAKVFLLTATWGAETVLSVAFTSADKLKSYTERHPAPEVSGYSMLEWELPQEVEVDPE